MKRFTCRFLKCITLLKSDKQVGLFFMLVGNPGGEKTIYLSHVGVLLNQHFLHLSILRSSIAITFGYVPAVSVPAVMACLKNIRQLLLKKEPTSLIKRELLKGKIILPKQEPPRQLCCEMFYA